MIIIEQEHDQNIFYHFPFSFVGSFLPFSIAPKAEDIVLRHLSKARLRVLH